MGDNNSSNVENLIKNNNDEPEVMSDETANDNDNSGLAAQITEINRKIEAINEKIDALEAKSASGGGKTKQKSKKRHMKGSWGGRKRKHNKTNKK